MNGAPDPPSPSPADLPAALARGAEAEARAVAAEVMVAHLKPIFDSGRAILGGFGRQVIDFVEAGLVAVKGRAAK
jgi:hypothetical protein